MRAPRIYLIIVWAGILARETLLLALSSRTRRLGVQPVSAATNSPPNTPLELSFNFSERFFVANKMKKKVLRGLIGTGIFFLIQYEFLFICSSKIFPQLPTLLQSPEQVTWAPWSRSTRIPLSQSVQTRPVVRFSTQLAQKLMSRTEQFSRTSRSGLLVSMFWTKQNKLEKLQSWSGLEM